MEEPIADPRNPATMPPTSAAGRSPLSSPGVCSASIRRPNQRMVRVPLAPPKIPRNRGKTDLMRGPKRALMCSLDRHCENVKGARKT